MLLIESQTATTKEKPFSKTHAPVYGIGVLEKFKGLYSNSFKNYCSKCPNYSYIFH